MTVSGLWPGALVSRSGHQSCGFSGAFKWLAKFRVSGVFRGHPSRDTKDKTAAIGGLAGIELSGSTAAKRLNRERPRVPPGWNASGISPTRKEKEVPMLYAILAYHVEADVLSWTPEEDATVMSNLRQAHGRMKGRLGPAVRLGATSKARTLRGAVVDGPFAETKEQLLGFYVLDCAGEEAALESARELQRVNPNAVYEIRPVQLYLPGTAVPDGGG
jgi:hypothetical protein